MFGTFPHCNSHKLWKRSTVRSLNDIVLSANFYSNKAKLHFAKTSNVCSFVREKCAFPRRKRHRREESAESALPNNLVRKKIPDSIPARENGAFPYTTQHNRSYNATDMGEFPPLRSTARWVGRMLDAHSQARVMLHNTNTIAVCIGTYTGGKRVSPIPTSE